MSHRFSSFFRHLRFLDITTLKLPFRLWHCLVFRLQKPCDATRYFLFILDCRVSLLIFLDFLIFEIDCCPCLIYGLAINVDEARYFLTVLAKCARVFFLSSLKIKLFPFISFVLFPFMNVFRLRLWTVDDSLSTIDQCPCQKLYLILVLILATWNLLSLSIIC